MIIKKFLLLSISCLTLELDIGAMEQSTKAILQDDLQKEFSEYIEKRKKFNPELHDLDSARQEDALAIIQECNKKCPLLFRTTSEDYKKCIRNCLRMHKSNIARHLRSVSYLTYLINAENYHLSILLADEFMNFRLKKYDKAHRHNIKNQPSVYYASQLMPLKNHKTMDLAPQIYFLALGVLALLQRMDGL